ncbi:unnamed protein product, partial [Urochloa humidicola]
GGARRRCQQRLVGVHPAQVPPVGDSGGQRHLRHGVQPAGGVWQDTDPSRGRIAGAPIMRETCQRRYLAYFYSNATAFTSSLMVIALIVILSVL